VAAPLFTPRALSAVQRQDRGSRIAAVPQLLSAQETACLGVVHPISVPFMDQRDCRKAG
jgi:hypothetical protein